MPDLVLRGGTVVDGTGEPAFEADVVVDGGRIAGVEKKYDGPAREMIDARGCIVTPGFIDVHTHLDAQLAWDPLGSPACYHGVTSVIVGNCGVGFAPCRPADRDYLMFLMEGVEDIPRAALKAGMKWDWETFPEYLEAIGRLPLGLNVGAHISHAPLRVYVMGERGATDTAASDAELSEMRAIVREALRAGALGVATGRTTMHRTPSGDPVPGTFADERELRALVGALAEEGRGVLEIIPFGGAGEDADGPLREFDWMEPLARGSARPFSPAIIQNLAYPDVWRAFLARAERANLAGARIAPQVAVRSVGILLGTGCAISPLALFPDGADLVEKSPEEVVAALRSPELRARLEQGAMATSGDILGGMAKVEHVFPLDDIGVRAYENSPDRSIVAIAERSGRHWGAVVLDHLLAHHGRGMFIVPLFNHDLGAVAEMLTHPLATIGLGDAGAHTTQTSDAGFATFLLAYWVRERKLLTMENAVRKLTAEPAGIWQIADRGAIRRGAWADLNVIDLGALDLELPVLRHEFPAGAPHLEQGARGYRATIVNGEVVMRDGRHTGKLPGKGLGGKG